MKKIETMRRIGAIAAAAAAIALTGCETVQTTQPGLVGVARPQRMLVSEEQMQQGAAQAYQQMLQEAKAKGVLNQDPALVARVRNIVSRLVPATTAFRSDTANWPWQVNVITTDELNAWCMPGGRMMVYTGLVNKIKLTDSQLAAILGHEMAHALREHSREQASRAAAENLGLSIAGAALGLGDAATNLAQLVTDVTFNLPNSRQAEQEADRIGEELAARAGYDPHAAVSVWQKMEKAGGAAPPQFLSTHPSAANRLADLQNYAERVMPLYQSAKK
jgi:predicted Zn-dependent protease